MKKPTELAPELFLRLVTCVTATQFHDELATGIVGLVIKKYKP